MEEKKVTTTNRKFSETDKLFQLACELGNIKPTSRQASKWRNGTGTALKFKVEATKQIQNQESK